MEEEKKHDGRPEPIQQHGYKKMRNTPWNEEQRRQRGVSENKENVK